MWNSPRSGSRNDWTRIKNVNGASSDKFLEFFRRDPNNFLSGAIGGHGRNLVISVPMTRRQANNQWSSGIAAHTASPQKIPSAKIRWKIFCLFLGGGSRRHPLHWLSSKGPNYQSGVLNISAGAIEWRFERKMPRAGRSPWESCSCTTMPRLTGHLHPRRNWPTWTSSVLITHPILRIWPVGLPPVPWNEKTIERSPFFFRRWGHCCRGDLFGRTTFWIFFWVACKSRSNRLRSVLNFVRSMLNKSRVWSL